MQKILLATLAAAAILYADAPAAKEGCYSVEENNLTVSWKAYKTFAKAGVGGTFNNVSFKPVTNTYKTPQETLHGASVVIDTMSVNSGNEGRDEKLVNAFFKMMAEEKITAKVVEVKPKAILVEITLNGKANVIPMQYIVEDHNIKAEGVIDLFDFSAASALASINKACYDLHAGKTWNDVAISFTLPLKTVSCQ